MTPASGDLRRLLPCMQGREHWSDEDVDAYFAERARTTGQTQQTIRERSQNEFWQGNVTHGVFRMLCAAGKP